MVDLRLKPSFMLTARQVATYFLSLVDEEAGDSLSNLKLQKLVYYAQGFHLALHGAPLFSEKLEAWEHGPVVPPLYRSFKQHGAEPIPAPEGGIDRTAYPEHIVELLDEVYSVYGQFAASKLRRMTHEEPPWREAYAVRPSSEVSLTSMRDYFSTLVNGKETQE
jgi:uncharacterized phage-associated protein